MFDWRGHADVAVPSSLRRSEASPADLALGPARPHPLGYALGHRARTVRQRVSFGAGLDLRRDPEQIALEL
jgi:hypothetical protein